MITRTCSYCGKPYETFPSIRLQFCGSDCANAAKRRGVSVPCEVCGKEVWSYPYRPRRFCSKSCARTAANLTDQNPAYTRDISGDKNPMHGVQRLGPENPMYGRRKAQAPRWAGGRKERKDGYVFVVAPDDHPYPAYTKRSGLKYILEHRLVMERHLGRYLDPSEVVHHKDENPSNNAIENLELFASQSEHIKTAHPNRRR